MGKLVLTEATKDGDRKVNHPLEERLVVDMIEWFRQYGRYGYRKIAKLLK